jgi:hypothetical protein
VHRDSAQRKLRCLAGTGKAPHKVRL